jgi:transcriptional regulator with XRE-family HTH domain
MPRVPLNNYLKSNRKRAALSQEEVAFLLGTESGTKVSRYETGRRQPSLDTALAFEALFGVSVRELFAGRFQKVEEDINNRAALLIAKLRAKGPSRATSRKLEILNAIRPDITTHV